MEERTVTFVCRVRNHGARPAGISNWAEYIAEDFSQRDFDKLEVVEATWSHKPVGPKTQPPAKMEHEAIVDLIREHQQDALRTSQTVKDADQRQGWASRAAALLELLREIPGTTEAAAIAARARREGIDY